jgi:hypothetical protein
MVLMLLLVAAAAFGGERTFEKEFQVGAGAELSLDCHKGTIRIRTHSASVIAIKARIYPDEGKNPELVDLVEIKTRASSGHVSVDVDYEQTEKAFNGLIGDQRTLPMVDFDIAIPDDAALDLSSHKAEFDVVTGSGKVEIESHKGSGTIKGVRNELDLETHKGDFKVEVEQLADLSVETHKGDVEVIIYGARDFSVRGESHDGELRFDGRDIRVEKDEEHHHGASVSYREGDGRNRIEISTHKGTVELRFVD